MSLCLVLFVLTCIENLQQKEEFLIDGTNVSFTFAFFIWFIHSCNCCIMYSVVLWIGKFSN